MARKTVAKPEVVEETPPIEVTFQEHEDDTITASFPSMNGSEPFAITLQEMNWGLMEVLEKLGDDDAEVGQILDFFRAYIVGGPKAVPFKHTVTVFEAIRAYIEQSADLIKNV